MRNKGATVSILDRSLVGDRKDCSDRLLGCQSTSEMRRILAELLNQNANLGGVFGRRSPCKDVLVHENGTSIIKRAPVSGLT